MGEYKCFRCGYIGKQRSHLKNHLNRKKMCNVVYEDMSIEEVKFFYNFEITQNSSKNPQKSSFLEKKSPQKSSILPKNILKNPQKSSILPKNILKNPHFSEKSPQKSSFFENQDLLCKYCSKMYSRIDNLKRHLNTCKKKKESEQLMLLEKELELQYKTKEIEELKKKLENKEITNITNINTTNNTNNTNNTNIIINNLGEENIKYLKSGKFAELLQGIYGAVPKLIQQIHFNPEHPENQNIKYPNKKNPYLKIMKNNKWQIVNKKPELLDLIDSKCFMLKEKYYSILEKGKYKLTDTQRSRIDAFMNKYDEEDTEVILDLINKTELILLNNS